MYEETGAGKLSTKMPFSTQSVDPPAASVNTLWGLWGPIISISWTGSSCKVSRALRLWPVEPKTLLKTSGTWFESLLPNRNPKQYIPGLHQNHVCAGPRLLRLSMDCIETTSRMRGSIPRFLGALLRN
jgi:hypothetical protein